MGCLCGRRCSKITHDSPKETTLNAIHALVGTTITMMTSSNGNIFRVTGHLCGIFTGHR